MEDIVIRVQILSVTIPEKVAKSAITPNLEL